MSKPSTKQRACANRMAPLPGSVVAYLEVSRSFGKPIRLRAMIASKKLIAVHCLYGSAASQ
jgi:hypothetical protein